MNVASNLFVNAVRSCLGTQSCDLDFLNDPSCYGKLYVFCIQHETTRTCAFGGHGPNPNAAPVWVPLTTSVFVATLSTLMLLQLTSTAVQYFNAEFRRKCDIRNGRKGFAKFFPKDRISADSHFARHKGLQHWKIPSRSCALWQPIQRWIISMLASACFSRSRKMALGVLDWPSNRDCLLWTARSTCCYSLLHS